MIQDYASMKFQYAEEGSGFMAELPYTSQKNTLDSKSEIETLTASQSTARTKKVGDKVGDNLSENQLLIIAHMRKNKFISASALATLIGISTRKIEENISKLKKPGSVQRLGPNKGGYWKV